MLHCRVALAYVRLPATVDIDLFLKKNRRHGGFSADLAQSEKNKVAKSHSIVQVPQELITTSPIEFCCLTLLYLNQEQPGLGRTKRLASQRRRLPPKQGHNQRRRIPSIAATTKVLIPKPV